MRWVNQLMMPGRKEWDVDLVYQMFHEYDAEEICKIRIPTSNVKDCIAWHGERSNVFSVCSAYKIGANLKYHGDLNASSSANDADDRSIWDLIWKTTVPRKVRISFRGELRQKHSIRRKINGREYWRWIIYAAFVAERRRTSSMRQ